MQIKRLVISIIVGSSLTASALAAPIIPVDLEYLYSKKTVLLDTASGDIEPGTYALTEDGNYYIVGFPNNVSAANLSPSAVTSTSPVNEEVTVPPTKDKEVEIAPPLSPVAEENLVASSPLDAANLSPSINELVPKISNTGTWDIKDKTFDVTGYIQAHIIGYKCTQYFKDTDGSIIVDTISCSDYDKLSLPDYPVPSKVVLRTLLFGKPVKAAVALDVNTTASTTSTQSFSFSHTVTSSGSNVALFVRLAWLHSSGRTLTSIKYNGVTLTSVASQNANTVCSVAIQQLVNPATGANNVVVATAGAPTEEVVVASSYTGVDQTTPGGTAVTATDTSTAPSVTVTGASGDIVIDMAAVGINLTATVGSGQTQDVNINLNSGDIIGFGSREDGAASVVMDWSLSSSQNWAAAGVAVKAAVVNVGLGAGDFQIKVYGQIKKFMQVK